MTCHYVSLKMVQSLTYIIDFYIEREEYKLMKFTILSTCERLNV
jgi:hypothetical protein